jgi:Protein of unknown function (DUF1569)
MHAVLERVVCQIANEVSGLDAETSQLHPHGLNYKWNAQQVVEHLVLGYRLTTSALETRLNKGHLARNRRRTYLQWLLQLMILSFGVLPQGAPALEETTPTPGRFGAMNGRELNDLLRQEMAAMDAALDRCRRKFGMERVANHPWLGALRVDQWRRFHVVHGLHHVAQLRSVIEQVAPAPAPIPTAAVPLRTTSSLVKEFKIPAQRPLA